MALAFRVCGLLVTSIGEWSREMLRKPYVIYGHLYSNGLRMSDIETTIHNTDKTKNPYMGIMPPVAGTSDEVDALARYLSTLRKPKPKMH